MKKMILPISIIVSVLFIFTACSPDKTATAPSDTNSGASVSKTTGKWVQTELKKVTIQMSESGIPTTIKAKWDELTPVINTDMKKEQVSDPLKVGLKNFQTDLEIELATSTSVVKTKLETIKTEIDDILAKINNY